MHFSDCAGRKNTALFLRATLLAFSLLLASLCQPAHAQSAAVSGLVLDPSGAAVPHAQITFTNERTGDVQRSKTNGVGMYSLPFVHPGKYSLSAEAAGFKRFEENAITVETAQNLALDVKLQVGSVNKTVTVSGSGIHINTTDGSVSTVINQQFVANIPLDGRSFQDLISLTPGVTMQTPQTAKNGTAGHGDFSVNGQRTEDNAYIVDGVSANTGPGSNGTNNPNGSATVGTGGGLSAGTAMGTTQSLLSVDGLQEFRVLSSSYSAEYGQFPGGQFLFTTRSGTNQYHGSASEYLRNNFTDANNWFNDYLGQKQAPLRMNDFGGTLGGPIRIPKLYNGNNKTFFFVSYEGLRSVEPQAASIQYVPTLSIRQSAASALQPFLNAFPKPTGAEQTVACTANATNTQTPCPSGDPAGTLVPSGLALYEKSFSNPSNFNSTSVRIDHNISSKMSVFFRYGYTPSQIGSRKQSVFSSVHYDNVTYTAGVTNQFSNSLGNSFRLNYTKSVGAVISSLDSFDGATPFNLADAMGIGANSNPYSSFSDLVTGVGNTNISTRNQNNHINQWNLVDTLSKSLGHHQLKFGFNYRRVESPLNPYDLEANAYFYNTEQLESNLAQRLALWTRTHGDPVFNYFGVFAQDEWRLTARFSLSYGLRWDIDPPPTNAAGDAPLTVYGSIADPSSLSLAPRGTSLYQTTYHNLAPRLGVAWQARTNPEWETVVRTGVGVFFNTNTSAVTNYFSYGPGLSGSSSYNDVSIPATSTQIAAASPSLKAPYSGIFATRHLQLPYTLQWNVSVQQSLGRAQTITASYVGANGRRLTNTQTFVPGAANTNFSSLYYVPGNSTSSYNALQLQFQRTLSHGLQALASYTWSHSIDLGSTNQEIPLKRGNSDFDLRHNLQVGISWKLPNVHGNQLVKQTLSHWTMDGRFIVRSGFPVAIEENELTDSATGETYYSGANRVAGEPLYIYGSACTAYYIANGNGNSGRPCPGGRAINPAAFSLPTGNDVGDAPRNFARGFGQNQINFAMRREFPIMERARLQFGAEAFNVLNHPIFGAINPTLGNSTFGEATNTLNSAVGQLSSLYQTGGPRSMQFLLRVKF